MSHRSVNSYGRRASPVPSAAPTVSLPYSISQHTMSQPAMSQPAMSQPAATQPAATQPATSQAAGHATQPAAPPETALIKDAQQLVACLRTMCSTDAAIVLYNYDESVKLLLRHDPEALVTDEATDLPFEVCMVTDDEEDATWAAVTDLEYDGFMDEDGATFVFDAMVVSTDDPASIAKAVDRINHVYNTALCKCERYLVRNRQPMCLFCVLTSSREDMQVIFCPICQDECVRRHMKQQPCCAQWLHQRCLNKWLKTAEHDSCPFCRKKCL